jgi:hypothetical protein
LARSNWKIPAIAPTGKVHAFISFKAILARRSHIDHHLATVARDLLLFLSRDNLNFFRSEPKDFKPIR